MKKYRLKKCDMNVDELKIKALLEGLEAQNIEEFMRQAKVGDYRNYGKAYISAVRNKIEEKESKPLFITEDGEKHFDKDFAYGINTHNLSKTFDNEWRRDDLPNYKVFKHESNADEYIWRNKKVFSYEDFMKWGNVPYERVIKQLAMERIEG